MTVPDMTEDQMATAMLALTVLEQAGVKVYADLVRRITRAVVRQTENEATP